MKKRPLYAFSLFLLILAILCCSSAAANAQFDPVIRVWLKRVQSEEALRMTVQGAYMLDGGDMILNDGAEVIFDIRNGQLIMYADSVAFVLGESAKLIRCDSENGSGLLLNDQSGLYEGDLHLSIKDNVIRPVLHIFIEDYLLGVVPYEMGDSFPLEALKAQAIAARTYALKKSGSSEDYDVEDTTNDQAYKGRSQSSPLSEQAVLETEGICGTYKGKLAWCYYSASNGGQTELGQHVWPTDDADDYAYMDMKDDPYDYENDASTVKRYTIPKNPGNDGVGTALHAALVEALKGPLAEAGYGNIDENLVRFDQVTSVKAVQPMYEEPSRLMSELEFGVKVSVRTYTYRDMRAEESAQLHTPSPDATPSPTPAPTATPAYSPYKRVKQEFVVRLPIFTDAERAMGLSINVKQNELISVFDIGSAFMVESRRFGHGVGMSQRGAQQMAARYDMSCEEILAFYYPRMDLKHYQTERSPMPMLDADIAATPAPTPSPTPRPTLMPVTKDKLPKGAYIAVVSNIDDDSSLNLRAAPTLSSEVVRRLYKHQELIVLTKQKDGWYKVRTDVVEGYVRGEYLQTAEKR